METGALCSKPLPAQNACAYWVLPRRGDFRVQVFRSSLPHPQHVLIMRTVFLDHRTPAAFHRHTRAPIKPFLCFSVTVRKRKDAGLAVAAGGQTYPKSIGPGRLPGNKEGSSPNAVLVLIDKHESVGRSRINEVRGFRIAIGNAVPLRLAHEGIHGDASHPCVPLAADEGPRLVGGTLVDARVPGVLPNASISARNQLQRVSAVRKIRKSRLGV